MFRYLAAVAAVLSVASPASARKVELMSFGAVGSLPVVEAVAGVDQGSFPAPPMMQEALASSFASLGGSPAISADVPSPTDGMSIPLWLQTGVARYAGARPGISTVPAIPAPPLVGCGDTSYRPRQDLPSSTEARRAKLFPLVAHVACEAGIPVGLFDALIVQESRYQVGALSPKGAAGLTQLMPGTARELGVRNSWDPLENLRGGALYLRRQLNDFGRVDLALAAYNAGPGRVRARRRVPAITETINYVATITRAWSRSSRTVTVTPVTTSSFGKPVSVGSARAVSLAAYQLP